MKLVDYRILDNKHTGVMYTCVYSRYRLSSSIRSDYGLIVSLVCLVNFFHDTLLVASLSLLAYFLLLSHLLLSSRGSGNGSGRCSGIGWDRGNGRGNGRCSGSGRGNTTGMGMDMVEAGGRGKAMGRSRGRGKGNGRGNGIYADRRGDG